MGLIRSVLQHDAQMAELDMRARELAEKRAAAKAAAERDQRLKELEAQRRIRPLIEDAYKNLGENPGQLKKAIGDIFQAYQMETGSQVDEEIIKALSEPEFGQQILDASTEANATLGDIFRGGRNPLLRAEARIALGGRANQRKAQEANIDDTPAPQGGSTGFTGGLQVPRSMLAEGVQQVPVPQAAPTAPATPAAAPQIDPRLKPAVDAIDARIADLEARRAVVIRANGNPKALDDMLKAERERRARLTDNPVLARVEAGIRRQEEAAPEFVQRDTGGRVTTRGQQEALRPAIQTPAQVEAENLELREAGKMRGDIRKTAEAARAQIPMYQRAAAVIEQAGRTGAQIGPLRQFLGEAGQLFLPDKTVQRLTKLSDLELLNQVNIEFALAGLKDVGGNDTERELLTLMRSKPGLLNTQQANRFATRWALASKERDLERDSAADKWIMDRQAEGKAASLRSRNAAGKSFTQRWDEYVNQRPLFVRVARDLGMDPVEFAASLGYDRERAAAAFGAR